MNSNRHRRLFLLSLILGFAVPLAAPHGRTAPPAFIGHHAGTRRHPAQTSVHQHFAATLLDSEMKTKSIPSKTSKVASTDDDLWNLDRVRSCAKLWELTAEETTKLQLLHAKLIDIESHPKKDPFEVVRFLDEFRWDVDVAERKFRDMMKWREENDVDSILDGYLPPAPFRHYPAAVLKGVDHEGDPIHCERTGVADTSGLFKRYGREEMIRHAIWLREVQSRGRWQEEYEQEHGHKVKQFTLVMDMKGLGPKSLAPNLLSIGQLVSRIIQDDYPGFGKRMIFIRAPAIFRLAYNAFKPFIDERARERIIISSGAKEDYKILEKYMDLDVLPPAIYEKGQGQAVDEFDTVWEGGKIPAHEKIEPRVVPLRPLEDADAASAPVGATASEIYPFSPTLLRRTGRGVKTLSRYCYSCLRRVGTAFHAVFQA